MEISRKGLIFIASLEGVCLTKYLCSAGVWTIGVGATRSEIPDIADWPKEKSLTIDECFDLLRRGIKKYTDAINAVLKVEISQSQFDALASICFNIGTGGLRGSTFMRRINAKAKIGKYFSMGFNGDAGEEWTPEWITDRLVNYTEDISMGFSSSSVTIIDAIMMWNKPKEIIGRRRKEANLYANANDYGDGKILVFPVNSKFQPIYSKGYQIDGNKYL